MRFIYNFLDIGLGLMPRPVDKKMAPTSETYIYADALLFTR